MAGLTDDEVEEFDQNGFHFPLDVLSESEAGRALDDWYRHLDVVNKVGGALSMHRYYPKIHLLRTWAHALVCDQRVLDAVESLIGPDILVWSTQIFHRKAGADMSVGWHQDAAYYGLCGLGGNAVRVWIALTPSTPENGTMRFSRGSHREGIREHGYPDEHKSRGEQILTGIDPGTEVDVMLRPGQASMHDLVLAHSSGVNVDTADRVNFAVDFLTPRIRPLGPADSALLVRGVDRTGHFEQESPPEEDFGKAELARFLRATGTRITRVNQLLQEHRKNMATG